MTKSSTLDTQTLRAIPVDCQKNKFNLLKKELREHGMQILTSSHDDKGNGFFKIGSHSKKDAMTIMKYVNKLDETWFIDHAEYQDIHHKHFTYVYLSLEKFKKIRLQKEGSNIEKTSTQDVSLPAKNDFIEKEEESHVIVPEGYDYEVERQGLVHLLKVLGFNSKHVIGVVDASKNSHRTKRVPCRSQAVLDLLFDVLFLFTDFFTFELPKARSAHDTSSLLVEMKYGKVFSGDVNVSLLNSAILEKFKSIGIQPEDINNPKRAPYTRKLVNPETIKTQDVTENAFSASEKVELSITDDSLRVVVAAELAMIRGAFNVMSTKGKNVFINEITGRSDKFIKLEELKDLGWVKADEYIVELANNGFKSKEAFEKDLKDALLKNKEALLKEIKDKGLVIVNPDDLFDKSVKGFNLKEVKL